MESVFGIHTAFGLNNWRVLRDTTSHDTAHSFNNSWEAAVTNGSQRVSSTSWVVSISSCEGACHVNWDWRIESSVSERSSRHWDVDISIGTGLIEGNSIQADWWTITHAHWGTNGTDSTLTDSTWEIICTLTQSDCLVCI